MKDRYPEPESPPQRAETQDAFLMRMAHERAAVGEIDDYLRLCDDALESAEVRADPVKHTEIIIDRAKVFFSRRADHPNFLALAQREMGRAEGILGGLGDRPGTKALWQEIASLDADMAGLVYEVAEPETITEPVWRPLEIVPQPTETTLMLPEVRKEVGWPRPESDMDIPGPLYGTAGD